MNQKSKDKRVDGVWVAPEFSLSKRTKPKLIPLPSSKPGLLASDSNKESSMARILELADVALSKKKRS